MMGGENRRDQAVNVYQSGHQTLQASRAVLRSGQDCVGGHEATQLVLAGVDVRGGDSRTLND